MQFEITDEENAKVRKWLNEVAYPPLIEKQLQDPETAAQLFEDENGKIKYPYLGAIGGGVTYTFTPTGLGVVTKVIFAKGTDAEMELDLTDYDCW